MLSNILPGIDFEPFSHKWRETIRKKHTIFLNNFIGLLLYLSQNKKKCRTITLVLYNLYVCMYV